MGWLGRLTGRTDPDPGTDARLEGIIDETLALLDAGGLAAFERQLRLAELVGDRDWQLDQAAGVLRMGADLVFPAQVLGAASAVNGTWRWSWANADLDPRSTRRAEEARAVGEARGMRLLSDPGFDLPDPALGHLVALAVSGLLDADAYYRCPYEGGAAFVLIEAPAVRVSPDGPLTRALFTITRAVESMPPLLTRPAISGYLRACTLPVTETDREILVADGEAATFRFDTLGHLAEIDGTLS